MNDGVSELSGRLERTMVSLPQSLFLRVARHMGNQRANVTYM